MLGHLRQKSALKYSLANDISSLGQLTVSYHANSYGNTVYSFKHTVGLLSWMQIKQFQHTNKHFLNDK